MKQLFDLAAARLNRGLSIKAAAREIGVHEHSLRSVEGGGSAHPATAKKIADFYGVQVTDFMPVDEAA